MDIREVYDAILIKTEASEKSISVDRYRAKLAINEAQNTLVGLYLKQKGTEVIRRVQHLLTPTELEKDKDYENYTDFLIPEDNYEISSASAIAKTELCSKGIPLDIYEIRDQNKVEILSDEFNKPSIYYREAPYNLINNRIRIYTDKFNISKVDLNYYRYPTQIRLIDEEDSESDFDRNFQLEFDKVTIERIIDMSASILLLENRDPTYPAHLEKSTT